MRYSNGGSGGQPAVTNNKAWKDLISNIPNQVVNEAGNSDLPGKDGGPYDTRATNASYYDSTTGTYKGYTFYSVSIESQRLPFFQADYDSLKASTYQSLYLQTAGKQLLSNQLKKCKRHYQHRNCLRRKSLIKRLNFF